MKTIWDSIKTRGSPRAGCGRVCHLCAPPLPHLGSIRVMGSDLPAARVPAVGQSWCMVCRATLDWGPDTLGHSQTTKWPAHFSSPKKDQLCLSSGPSPKNYNHWSKKMFTMYSDNMLHGSATWCHNLSVVFYETRKMVMLGFCCRASYYNTCWNFQSIPHTWTER